MGRVCDDATRHGAEQRTMDSRGRSGHWGLKRASYALLLVLPTTGCMMEMESRSVRVTREQFGESWPLTVPSGLVSCESTGRITFQWNGTQYSVTKPTPHDAYENIDAITADRPDGKGKKDLAPLIDRGRRLCN